MKNPTKLQLAYIGGLFDGEGSSGIYVINRKDKKRDGQRLICPTIQFKMCDPEPMELVRSIFVPNHKMWLVNNRWSTMSKNPKPYYCVTITYKKAYAFAKAIYPYLKIESKRGKLAKIIYYYESSLNIKRIGKQKGDTKHPLGDILDELNINYDKSSFRQKTTPHY